MFKRFFLFFGVNILVMVTVSLLLNIFGVNHYITASGLDYNALMAFCLIWGMAGSFISLMLSKWMAKRMMGIEIVANSGPYAELVQIVHRLSKQAGITTMPEVGVFHSPEVNAFATGPSKNNSLVAVSSGLLERMNRDEIEGVLGHEVAHIANGDMVTMALLQGIMNAFVMFFARIIAFAIDQAMRKDDDEGQGLGGLAHFAVVMVLELIFGMLAGLVLSWFSRHREFRADAGGAKLAGREKMVGALEALMRTYNSIPAKEAENFKSMKISSKKSFLALFSTHPPLEARIRALQYRS